MKHFRWRAAGRSAHRRVRAAAAAVVLACLSATPSFAAVTPVHKCTENGVVSFQNTPCRPEEPGARPTAAQLNAERQQKLRQQAGAANSAQRQPPAAASAAPSQARKR